MSPVHKLLCRELCLRDLHLSSTNKKSFYSPAIKKINRHKPILQYSHSCPIFHIVFVILFAQTLLKTPCCLLTILPFLPIVGHVHCSAPSHSLPAPCLRQAQLAGGRAGRAGGRPGARPATNSWQGLRNLLRAAAGRGRSCLNALCLKTKPCSKGSSAPEQPAFPTTAC